MSILPICVRGTRVTKAVRVSTWPDTLPLTRTVETGVNTKFILPSYPAATSIGVEPG